MTAEAQRRSPRPALASAAGGPLAGPRAGGHRAVAGLPRRGRGRPGRHRRRSGPAGDSRAAAPGGRGPQEAGRRGGRPRPAWRRAASAPANSADHRSRPGCSPRLPRPGTARAATRRPELLNAAEPHEGRPPEPGRTGQDAGWTCHTMTAVPMWAWAVTLAVLAVLIVVDLVLTRGPESSLRAAAVESALWLAAALAFGAVLWLWRGPTTGSQYLAGYLLERALSVDNVFVFVLLFVSMRIPAELQKRILFLGVVGALVLRGVFIAAGGALIESVSWIFYVFGAMVLLAGARMFRAGEGGSGEQLRRARPAPGAAGHRALRRRTAPHPGERPGHGHAPARGAGGHRGNRRGVRARLDPGRVRRDQGPVRGVHVQRLRRPRPAGAVLPAGGFGGPVRLPQAGYCAPAGVHRREDAPVRRGAHAGLGESGGDRGGRGGRDRGEHVA